MNKINDIIELLREEFPGLDPRPGKADPLDILIATMLSQNTTDKTSYRAFMNLKNDIGSWEDVLNAPLGKIKKAIRVCGLTNQKSAAIKKLLKELKQKHGKLSLKYLGKLSDEKIYEDLLQYDGVGLKTISCVMAFSLGRDVFPVDTHVHRVTNRLGIVNAVTPVKTFEQVKDKIPEGKKFLLHTLLIRFGRKICRSQNPLCGSCRLYDLCSFREKEFYAEKQDLMKNKTVPVDNNFIILEHV